MKGTINNVGSLVSAHLPVGRADVTANSESDFQHLVGRDRERVAVENLLAALPHGGASLAWAGERGHGKTAVLSAARTLAAHARVRILAVRGATIANLANGLVRTVHAQLDITAGNGPESSASTDGRSIHRLLQRLSDAATLERPVLLCLDDLDLLHPNDVASVAFAARRLTTLPVLLLATTGPTLTVLLERGGIPVHGLHPFTDPQAAQILAQSHADLHPQVADRIIAEAAGSPLPLLELPTALTSRQRHGLDALPSTLPLNDRLREAYAAPLDALSRPAQDVLTLTAISGSDGVLSLLSSDQPSIDPSALDELEQVGLLVTHNGDTKLRFSHPLVRNAVLDRVSNTDLERARDLLATAFPTNPDQQARHLADAWGQPDGYLASRLERSARRATERGDVDQAVAAMVRAAHLSPDRHIRSRRLLEAAHLQATITGEMDAAAAALAEAARADADSAVSIRAAATSGQLMMAAGAPLDEVFRLVIEPLAANTTGSTADRAAAHACLQLLFYVCLMTARAEQWRVFDQLMEQHRSRGPVVGLLASVLPDITKTTPVTLAQLDAAIAELTDSVDPAEVIGVSVAAYHLDRLGPCRAALWRVADDARRGQMVGIGIEAMLRLALDNCHTGQLPQAARLAAEGSELALTIGRQEHVWTFQLCLALIAALRGDQHQVDTLTREMITWATPRGAQLIDYHCAHIRGLAALGQGDFEAAYAHGVSINPPGTLAGHTGVTFAACLDLVEAAVYTHRQREASAHSVAMAESGVARLSPRFALRVATAAAMTAPDLQAPDLFEQALAIPNVDRWPFDRARAQLAYGARLRRLRLATAAQPPLDAAYETFRRLGARGWTHRATEEMRAAGLPTPPDQRPPRTVLTGRDLEIATLAAAGLSNQEIGAKLFLSPRTVGSRLYRIFPELGVSSRAGLRDALEEQAGQNN